MTDKREVQNLFDTAKKKLSDRQFVRFMKIYNKYKDVVPFPIKQIATENYGKNLLLGSDWQGEIDLDDVIDRKYFEDYLFGKR
jgi:LEA14-like dessication related protein